MTPKEKLMEVFTEAQNHDWGKHKYYGVAIKMEGYEGYEVIINPLRNNEKKMAYYDATYDEQLNHRFAKGIEIIGWTAEERYELIGKTFHYLFDYDREDEEWQDARYIAHHRKKRFED